MKRDNFIKIRVSADELSDIKSKAEKAMMNLSDYVRTSAINGQIILYNTQDIFQFNRQIRAIGNNINQIAVVVNSENRFFRRDLEDMQVQIRGLQQKFKQIIKPLKFEEI